jgi:hypothetical protein
MTFDQLCVYLVLFISRFVLTNALFIVGTGMIVCIRRCRDRTFSKILFYLPKPTSGAEALQLLPKYLDGPTFVTSVLKRGLGEI